MIATPSKREWDNFEIKALEELVYPSQSSIQKSTQEKSKESGSKKESLGPYKGKEDLEMLS